MFCALAGRGTDVSSVFCVRHGEAGSLCDREFAATALLDDAAPWAGVTPWVEAQARAGREVPRGTLWGGEWRLS